MNAAVSTEQLIACLQDARTRTLELIEGLSDEQLVGPKLPIVNPLRWEIGHVAYFHEYWILRHLDKRKPLIPNADEIYDSISINHDVRWDLPLPSLPETLEYMRFVLAAVIERLDVRLPTDKDKYLTQYAVFHEDMHTEAFTYTRQTLGYPEPRLSLTVKPAREWQAGPLEGDVEVPGGTFMLGAPADTDFVFDNEKWAHPVQIKPFAIARAPVTNEEFARFVQDRGYHRPELWSAEGRRWLETTGLEHPIYWERANGMWMIKRFDRLVSLPPHAPVVHVSWYEAEAYCRWAKRRLPTEAEWEFAAAAEPTRNRKGIMAHKRQFPWGGEPPKAHYANLDGRAMGCVDVAALPAGDSALGCRQMIGNVWEWTSTTFYPYPGFTPDMYKEYSQPLFGNTKVLRGGSWASRSRMLRNTWRNYYGPGRNDVFAGFRTCAV